MKKLTLLFVLLIGIVFVGCANVPDFPSNQQFIQILHDKDSFVVTSQIYFSEGSYGSFKSAYYYPEFEYTNKYGDKNTIEFNYVCGGYYKSNPEKNITIFVKMLRKKDTNFTGNYVDHLKIVWEM